MQSPVCPCLQRAFIAAFAQTWQTLLRFLASTCPGSLCELAAAAVVILEASAPMSFACVQEKHLWSTGYDVSLTRCRSPVRSWPGVLSIAVQKVRSKVRPGEARRARQAERGLAEQQHHGIKGCRGSVWHYEKLDPGRTRTCNLWFRRPTPYPLGHRTCMQSQGRITLSAGRAGRSRRKKKK